MTQQVNRSPALPTAAEPLFLMAMDQRDSFAKTVFGITGEPSSDELKAMRDAKLLIFEAAQRVLKMDLPSGPHLGVLVDEQLGADVARQAKDAGFQLAMPVERSGAARFIFEYGDDFAGHVEAFDPDWVKALLRFNPEDAQELKQAQIAGLARLSGWCGEKGRRWILELLVPPTREQLAACEDQALFDEQARPTLTKQVMTELLDAGVGPDIWKLEGYETAGGAEEVLDVLSRRAVSPVCCIVLGRNAPLRQVDHWLSVAAPLEGFAGFAIGRSNWYEPITDYLAGRSDRGTAQSDIAERYRHFIDEYLLFRGRAGDGTK